MKFSCLKCSWSRGGKWSWLSLHPLPPPFTPPGWFFCCFFYVGQFPCCLPVCFVFILVHTCKSFVCWLQGCILTDIHVIYPYRRNQMHSLRKTMNTRYDFVLFPVVHPFIYLCMQFTFASAVGCYYIAFCSASLVSDLWCDFIRRETDIHPCCCYGSLLLVLLFHPN